MTYKCPLALVVFLLLFCPGPLIWAQEEKEEETKQEITDRAQPGTQQAPPAAPPPAQAEEEEDPPIQDNSFLMEEAYNQEYGVVQHINFFGRFWEGRDWTYTFTQEWPVNPAPRHQLSYTISAGHAGALTGSGAGLGDIALNYRYQAVGSGKDRVAFSPRFSLLLPTGDSHLGRGAGAVSFQTNLPLSVAATKKLVTHWNAGATFTPSAKNELDQKALTAGYNLGTSFIWLAHPRFNTMLELVFDSSESVVAPDVTQRENSLLLSPGFRWAHNLKNGLQIVPGFAVPIGVGPSRGEKGIIFYLSFEHAFKKSD
ncbi:MAG: hypothetical protein ACRD2Q_05930 [Terriglobales bacterium]